MSDGSDWDQLSRSQQDAVDVLRAQMIDHLTADAEAFYRLYPDLQLSWRFELYPLLRGQHGTFRNPDTLEEL